MAPDIKTMETMADQEKEQKQKTPSEPPKPKIKASEVLETIGLIANTTVIALKTLATGTSEIAKVVKQHEEEKEKQDE
jgi:hypothetical protein